MLETQLSEENLLTFPEEWKDKFEGLLYLGYLKKEVNSIPFHKFVIKTLTVNEKLEISLLTKPYEDTVGYGRAYRAAVVAAALESVDGRRLVPASKGSNVLQQKYDYVVNGWYDFVIDILYVEVDQLEGQVLSVLQELGIFQAPGPTPIFEDEVESENDNPKDGK